MEDLTIRLDSIQKKIEELIQQKKLLINKNNILAEENGKLLTLIDNDKLNISKLEEEKNKLKITNILQTSSEDVHAIKLTINEYIREIDKCIDLLNQ